MTAAVGSAASIDLPPSLFNLVPKDGQSVGVGFTLYQIPAFFPITSQKDTDNTTSRVRAVGSVVVAATVGFGLTFRNIDSPVLTTISLQNPENVSAYMFSFLIYFDRLNSTNLLCQILCVFRLVKVLRAVYLGTLTVRVG